MKPTPLINLRPYQLEAFNTLERIAFFVWRRQSGKSYMLAAKCLQRMLYNKNHSCFVVSASIATGREIIEKEASLWYNAIEKMKQAAEQAGCKLGGNIIDSSTTHCISLDDLAEMIEKQSAQIRLYHTRTSYSRTKIIAPNPDTCRGWTGDIFGDEFAFWPQFSQVWDGVEPFISSNPEYLLWCFTTPPYDDTHPTHELLNPAQQIFSANACGNHYRTESGYLVHRVDAYDSALADVPMYHPRTGKPCSYIEYRENALNKSSADRNFALSFNTESIAAISKAHMDKAQSVGAGKAIARDLVGDTVHAGNIEKLIGRDWTHYLTTGADTAIGLDLASTTKKKSNPSALTITQSQNGRLTEIYTTRLKTDKTSTLIALLKYIVNLIPAHQLKGLAVDKSNERLAAQQIADELHCRVIGYAGGEKVKLRGEQLTAKYAMGSTYASLYEDSRIAIAPDKWLSDDRRTVVQEGADFSAPVTEDGYHADTFDSGKLAAWLLLHGRAESVFMPRRFNQNRTFSGL